MKLSVRKGFSFGLVSGIITTLGMLVGLKSGTNSKIIVIGGIIMIAIADAMSDSLGMHISEESSLKNSNKEIWESTFSTFLSKALFALTFIIPVLIFKLDIAVWVSLIWGFSLIAVFSYYLGKKEKIDPKKVIAEHMIITVIVIICTYIIGTWISNFL